MNAEQKELVFTWADDSHVLRVCASVVTEGSRTFHQILLLSSTPKTSEEDWSTASCVVRHRHRRENIRICERKNLFTVFCCTNEINFCTEICFVFFLYETLSGFTTALADEGLKEA